MNTHTERQLPRSQRLIFIIRSKLHQELEEEAARQDRPKSEIIREALVQYLERRRQHNAGLESALKSGVGRQQRRTGRTHGQSNEDRW